MIGLLSSFGWNGVVLVIWCLFSYIIYLQGVNGFVLVLIRPNFVLLNRLNQSSLWNQHLSSDLYFWFLQEKIMRVPYGAEKEYFKYSLFLVFCNRITTSAVSAGSLLVSVCHMQKSAVTCMCRFDTFCSIWILQTFPVTEFILQCFLQASKKAMDPVAPVFTYCLISVSNILTTTCQYEVSVILSVGL